MRIRQSVVLLMLACANGLQGQSGAAVSVDAVEAEYEGARANTQTERDEYDANMVELNHRIASGQVTREHAGRLQRLFLLDVYEAELKETAAYLKRVDSYSFKSFVERENLQKSADETKRALDRMSVQREAQERQVKGKYGPAVLTQLEFEKVTGGSLPSVAADAEAMTSLDQLLTELDAGIRDGKASLANYLARIDQIDRSGPSLEARRVIAQQRADFIRTKSVFLRDVSNSMAALEAPNFKPLPELRTIPPASASVVGRAPLDIDAVRKRIQP